MFVGRKIVPFIDVLSDMGLCVYLGTKASNFWSKYFRRNHDIIVDVLYDNA